MATAIDAVLEAGAIQKAHYGRGVTVSKKGAIDLVTEVDVAVERRVRALIDERFPTHAVLAEEFQQPGDLEIRPGFCWVFDPLDGTTNFAHGLPLFCASVGVELDGDAVYGAIYDPMRDELFTAERGGGAFLNGERLRVSSAPTLLESLLCTGFPYDVHGRIEELVHLFALFLGRARAVRRLGSAALDLCYVAAGRFDGFWEVRLNPWDTCAGALIAREAGADVSRWDGQPYQSRHQTLVASNGRIHEEMLAAVREHLSRYPDFTIT
jgi:myo-inositol-1(or 4)-monophosphatase